MSRFLAIDWGTTNRRVYVIDAGEVVATERDGCGILAVPEGGFASELEGIRTRFGPDPVLLAGMVGSNRGWVDAGYVDCPVTLDTLAGAMAEPLPGVRIVPGVKRLADGRADVMRGEEIQLLGAVEAGLAPGDALLCQPGTHCKWARMAGGAITDFHTAMTGELFALIKGHALIGREMVGDVADDEGFAAGVAESGRHDLLVSLFGVRPASILGLRPPEQAASYVSGLLIGCDVRARLEKGGEIYLLADPVLGALYARAIAMAGGTAHLVDSHAAFVAGITQLQDRLS